MENKTFHYKASACMYRKIINPCWARWVSFLTTLALSAGLLAACAPTQSNYEGAGVGGAIGAAAGALIDRGNPWRGAVIGGALGAVAGGTMAEISKRAVNEAREAGRPVSYQRQTSNGGWEKVEAVPQQRYGQKRCVTVKTFENGHLTDETQHCD